MTFNDENTYKGIASMYIDFKKKKNPENDCENFAVLVHFSSFPPQSEILS